LCKIRHKNGKKRGN